VIEEFRRVVPLVQDVADAFAAGVAAASWIFAVEDVREGADALGDRSRPV
jgi:hypothetical protein